MLENHTAQSSEIFVLLSSKMCCSFATGEVSLVGFMVQQNDTGHTSPKGTLLSVNCIDKYKLAWIWTTYVL